jgi:hypothetical protein
MTERDTEQVGAAIQAAMADVRAPDALRARVEAERTRARPALRRRAPVFGLAGAALVACAAAVVVLLLGGDDRERPIGPTLEQATLAAVRPAHGPAPAEDEHEPTLVRARINGLQFPYWDDEFGLEASGVRRERIGGRNAMTVTYESKTGGEVVGYTIVAGAPLAVPQDAHVVSREHVDFAVLEDGATKVVTWRRAGHTCVLASRDASAYRLLDMAAWTGAGGVGGYPR